MWTFVKLYFSAECHGTLSSYEDGFMLHLADVLSLFHKLSFPIGYTNPELSAYDLLCMILEGTHLL